MIKQELYSLLVQKRKSFWLCTVLTNLADGSCYDFDFDQIGPWSFWHGSLDADILIVGQDWGDTSYFLNRQGKDQPSGNPTNENLQKLLSHIGISVGMPRESQNQIIFFTNLYSTEKKILRGILDEYIAALESEDVERLSKIFADDTDLASVSAHIPGIELGIDKIQATASGWFKAVDDINLTVSN